MKLWICWLLIIGSFQPSAWGLDPNTLIRAPQASAIGYRAWLATQPRLRSYSEWWIRNRVSNSDEIALERKLELSQIEFLQGGLAKARELFLQVTHLEHSQDWRAAERKAFAYTYLRLAQMTNNVEERQSLLTAAASWGPMALNQDHFPPPLWRAYKLALARIFDEQMDLDLWFPGIRFLLVDGRPFEAVLSTRLPVDSARHRFTLVFDHAAPQTLVATWQELKTWRPIPTPLVAGTCDNFKPLSHGPVPTAAQIYFANDCVVSHSRPTPTHQVPAKEVQALGGDWLKTPSSEIKTKPNGWLWAGIGVVAIGSLLLLNRKEESKASPSTTVGF